MATGPPHQSPRAIPSPQPAPAGSPQAGKYTNTPGKSRQEISMEYDPNPPTPEEVAEAFRFKYGA